MEKQVEMILVLHILNFIDSTKNQLLAKLRKKLNSDRKVKVDFMLAEQYWKIPEHTRCVFKLIFEDVDEGLLEKLPSFLGVKTFALLGNNSVIIWDKKTHGGIFLHENIEWVHLYIGSK